MRGRGLRETSDFGAAEFCYQKAIEALESKVARMDEMLLTARSALSRR
jgi:hypothetical protein